MAFKRQFTELERAVLHYHKRVLSQHQPADPSALESIQAEKPQKTVEFKLQGLRD